MARVACLALALIALGTAVSACGEQNITVPKSQPVLHRGAVLFSQRCSGCHTLRAAATRGSATNIRTAERTDGPNLNLRKESVERVLFAIHNGGFSGAIMPQNVVLGPDAQAVAAFVAKYSGAKISAPPSPLSK
jgi:mono/diheme cytochrome c family protein